MSGILILTAVELEARTLARELEFPLLPSLPFPAFGRDGVLVAPVGLRASLLDARWSHLADGPERRLIISAGTCGGLDPRLRPGDLVIPESVLSPSGELYNVTPSQHRRALGAAATRVRGATRSGLLITTRDVVGTPDAKAELHARTGALAADLESAVILARAAATGCISLVVRGVSDGAAESLPAELIGLVTPEGKLRSARALALMASRPTVLPRALALKHSTRKALRAVASLLAALIG
ncbi:MAG TPA: hypothetical protein VFO18_08350 [Methylomirabilota bacterium]|nr:hypothetical protein [Methylomirabilota bacterium]